MLKEITRIGLLSAGSVCGWTLAGLVLVLGAIAMVGIGVSGDFSALDRLADLEAGGMSEPETAGLLAAFGVFYIFTGAVAALVGGFLLGLFLAAVYNVTAGIAGGIKIEFDGR